MGFAFMASFQRSHVPEEPILRQANTYRNVLGKGDGNTMSS